MLTCTPRVLHQLSLFVFLALLGGITGATSSLLEEEAYGLLCALRAFTHVPYRHIGHLRVPKLPHSPSQGCCWTKPQFSASHSTSILPHNPHDSDISCRLWKPVFLTGTKELQLSRTTLRSLRIEKRMDCELTHITLHSGVIASRKHWRRAAQSSHP